MVKYITNMDRAIEICAYNIENGDFTFIEDKNNEIETDWGYFVREKDNIYGILESQKDYIFFKNNSRYNLSDLNYKFIFNNIDEDFGNFKFTIDKKIIIDIVYEKPIYAIAASGFLGFGEAEEDLDFFQHICKYNKKD